MILAKFLKITCEEVPYSYSCGPTCCKFTSFQEFCQLWRESYFQEHLLMDVSD